MVIGAVFVVIVIVYLVVRVIVIELWGSERVVVADLDPNLARLLRLGVLPHQIDLEQSTLERSAIHLNILGEVKHPPEGREEMPS
jgi:hypothetical protein